MSSSASNYSYLISKIDEFIRKYYLNKVVRGSLYLAASFFASYTLVALAEYFGNFSPVIRTTLFFSFILLNGFILTKWIIIPLLHFYKLGTTISHEKAAEIIGEHFSHIKDKLLNTLQLKKLAEESQQKDLIEASINQKITELKPVPFTTAIQIKDNKRYLRYALPPLAILILIGATAPSILSESTVRLIKYDQKFIKKAPFQFVVLNKDLRVVQGEDLELKVKLTGKEIPQDIYLEDGSNTFKLEKDNIVNFRYTFRNIQETKKIFLSAGEFSSEPYTIEVKKNPSLLNFDVFLEYPSYIGKKNESLNNSGDLTVPEGTKITWKFRTENADNILFSLYGKQLTLNPTSDNFFVHSAKAFQKTHFSIKTAHQGTASKEESAYTLNTIPDAYPLIQVDTKSDSLNTRSIYCIGRLSDDYGFTSLRFVYKIEGAKVKTVSKELSISKNTQQSNFFYTFNVKDLEIKPGEKLEYYFEVADNDAIHGAKLTRSPSKVIEVPTISESEKKLEQAAKAVEKKMEQAIRQASQVEKDAKKLTQDLLNKRNLSFEEKKQIEQLLQKQKDLENLVKEIKEDNKQNINDRHDLKEQNLKIQEKQKQIEDLFNNVLDEKTKELLKNIEKLLEQNNKNQTQQEISKVQADNKVLQKELDRILELYKQLEFDQKLNDVTDKLDKLSEKQQQLKDQTEKKNQSSQELKKQQDQLNKDFKDIKEALKDLEQKNENLEKKNDFENPEKEQQQIEQNLEQSSDNLDQKNNKKAAERQQQAAQQMKQLSQKLSDMQQESEQEENQINLQSLRQILDNLVSASFDQESVMQYLRATSQNDPNYIKYVQKQKDIKDNLKGVQDSLYALSKKVSQIETAVNKEIQDINKNIDIALNHLSERRTAEANRNQQYAMTSINNLALMLSDIEVAMQRMMQNMQQGGKGKQKSVSQLRQMQQQLNQNMEKARQQMQQQGNNPGKSGQGKGQMSEQFARMAREQQMIRESLQEINRDLNKDGKAGLGNLDKLSKEMEQSETDLVNKRIQQETLFRQQEILTKLLDAEKAERERELDKKRESKQGKEQSPNYKVVLDQFKKNNNKEIELLKTVPPDLNSFYKLKTGDYFRLLNSNQ